MISYQNVLVLPKSPFIHDDATERSTRWPAEVSVALRAAVDVLPAPYACVASLVLLGSLSLIVRASRAGLWSYVRYFK
jgi:hypothetical protein